MIQRVSTGEERMSQRAGRGRRRAAQAQRENDPHNDPHAHLDGMTVHGSCGDYLGITCVAFGDYLGITCVAFGEEGPGLAGASRPAAPAGNGASSRPAM